MTTFSETDSAGDLTVTSTTATFDTMARSANCFLSKDYGAGHFGNFTIDFEVEITAVQTDSIVQLHVGNTPGTVQDVADSNDAIRAAFDVTGSSIYMVVGDTNTDQSQSTLLSNNTAALAYYRLTRSGTTATLKRFSDAARTVETHSVSCTCQSGTLRYLTAVANRDSSGTAYISGYIRNVDIISAS